MEAIVRGSRRPDPGRTRHRRARARVIGAAFALLDGGRVAVVEQAQASGLWRLRDDERDAVAASSRGTGELIRAAIDAGAREVVVTVGGSATTDGGRGALEALGAHFTTRTADLRELRRTLRGVKLSLACDVRTPMCGPDGAARTFAPQKGASPDEVEQLERRLVAWARLARRTTGARSRRGADGRRGRRAGRRPVGVCRRRAATRRRARARHDRLRRRDARVVRGRDRRGLAWTARRCAARRCSRSRPAAARAECPATRCRASTGSMRSTHRLMNVEVEAAARNGAVASEADVERAARRVAQRLLPP